MSFLHQRMDVLTIEFCTLLVERSVESKELDVIEEHMLEVCHGFVVPTSQELEEILEHATGCARCRHKFHYVVIGLQIFVPLSRSLFQSILIGLYYSIGNRGCSL